MGFAHLTAFVTGDIGAGSVVDALGRSLRAAGAMFVSTFWALVLGFVISGAVQAYVRGAGLRRHLGNHRPPAVARATLLGSISSSCSYAAAAAAHSLVRRGADFTTAMVFMFASTNLVIELGIIIVVLLGWTFLAAQAIGGLIMISALALVGSRVFPPMPELVTAETASDSEAPRGRHDRVFAAARYTTGDLRMLGRELLLGFLLAGLISTVVPTGAWRAAFLTGHGLLGEIENALVAPAVALVSCVCSIGNVPLAAALWQRGVSFVGVLCFLFADLLAFPLVLVYRRLYGGRRALRMVVVLWGTISLAGLLTAALFAAVGIGAPARPAAIASNAYQFGPTTVLNIAAALLLIAVLLAARRGAGGLDIDPVCAMAVDRANAAAVVDYDGQTFVFCSTHCRDQFRADTPKYVASAGPS